MVRARNSYEPGARPSSRAVHGTVLKSNGQTLGLPVFESNPQISCGDVPAGRIVSQSSGGGIRSQGCQVAVFQAGSLSVSPPSAPVPERSQNSTFFNPDHPTIAVPSMSIGLPALNESEPLP